MELVGPLRLVGRLLRRLRRKPVLVTPDGGAPPDDIDGFFDDGDEGPGSAGVREPRRPKPLGPMAGAGEAVPPEPPLVAKLPDPRH